MPLPVAMTLGHLTGSGGESEIVRLGVSVGAPFWESGQLRSHVTTTAIGVDTDQPRGVAGSRGDRRHVRTPRCSVVKDPLPQGTGGP